MIKLSKEQIIMMHSQLLEQTGGIDGIRDEGLLGTHAMLVFLAINGVELQYTQKELYSIILNVAFGEKNEQDLWEWILEHQK